MAQRKTIEEQIALAQEEKAQKEHRLNELLQKKKEQDRKARTHRLIQRGAMAESFIPDAETLTNEQFQSLLFAAFSGAAVRETSGNPQKQVE